MSVLRTVGPICVVTIRNRGLESNSSIQSFVYIMFLNKQIHNTFINLKLLK